MTSNRAEPSGVVRRRVCGFHWLRRAGAGRSSKTAAGAPLMNSSNRGFVMGVALFGLAFALRAELRLEPADERQVVFATRAAKIKVIFRNPSAESHKSTLRYRIFQATSITAMPVGSEQVWKELEVLGGQTVLETVEVTLPAVKVATPFLARWRDDAGHVLGHTTILACPGDQLARFGTDGVGSAIGVFDRRGKLFPVLSRAGLPCERLETLEQLNRRVGDGRLR